ncbi:carbohydrate-binding protein [Pendulispora albinea]|uniref:Carbohydrate-binding protein n=1 Tax=Pendulispora albinea TaxID=2741071 RepID=A0ABZ2LT35_9BACT
MMSIRRWVTHTGGISLLAAFVAALGCADGTRGDAPGEPPARAPLAGPPRFDAGSTLRAAAFTSKSNPNPHLENNDTTLGFFDVGTWFCFDGVEMSGVGSLGLRMAAANTGGVFSVRIDGNAGTEIGRYTVATSTGGWGTWETRTMTLTPVSGVHSLCLRGESGYGILNLAWLELGQTTAAVGATTPFVSYEAEAGRLGGGAAIVALTSPPTTPYSSPELESSGHAYVRLNATHQYVEWVNDTEKNITFIDVRASIPDSADGKGLTATLDLYVDGAFRQTLTLTSKQTWGYEGNDHYNNESQNPSDGRPRTFFDDVHTFITGAAVAPGSTLRLQKSAANTAAFYDIDVVDVEAPPAPLAQTPNSLSIAADCGAVANDRNVDNSGAIQTCIDRAASQGKSLWIPPGAFYVRTVGGLHANGITIEGAGMWYSTIYRNMPLPNVNGSGQPQPLGAIFNLTSCTVRNFALDANATSRAQIDGAGGAMDTTGTHWVADGIWTQHTMSGFWASGTGGTVKNCRLTSIWADGCNINNVSNGGKVGNDLTVQNNFVRGTGDDAIAINSVDYNDFGPTRVYYTPMARAKVINNTSIAPWGGKGVAVYGGGGHEVRNNAMSDTARYIGLGVGKFGANGSNLTSATVTGNLVVRCGGNAYVQQQPALHIGNGGDGHETGTVANATVSENTIVDALYNGVGFSASTDTLLRNNTIRHPGLDGIVISPPFYPAPTGSAAIRDNMVTGLNSGKSAFRNLSSGFTATLSGNNW